MSFFNQSKTYIKICISLFIEDILGLTDLWTSSQLVVIELCFLFLCVLTPYLYVITSIIDFFAVSSNYYIYKGKKNYQLKNTLKLKCFVLKILWKKSIDFKTFIILELQYMLHFIIFKTWLVLVSFYFTEMSISLFKI